LTPRWGHGLRRGIEFAAVAADNEHERLSRRRARVSAMMEVVDLFTESGGVGAVALIAGWWVRHRHNERQHQQEMRRLDLVEAATLSGDPAAAGRLRGLL
jgi:hypothetical protein